MSEAPVRAYETCVACGDVHADPETATRIGISYVAVDCAWTLRYPGQSASEVIEGLEFRLEAAGEESPPATVKASPNGDVPPVAADEQPTTEMPVSTLPSDDPAERVEHNQFLPEVPCPVCDGEGALAPREGADGGLVECARCAGTGRVKTSA